jgi:LmbE family N-acetylglucosaminyl deacetylase/SAM-dependent methyltransferase
MVTFDSREPGTSASAWRQDERMSSRPPLDWEGVEGVLVVAAHPDDETLGAGGLIAHAQSRGLPVEIIVVTDGAASEVPGIAERRSSELASAVRLLAPSARILELGLPDGATDRHRDDLRAALAEQVGALPPGTLLVAPWVGDGHRDHRVVGEEVTAVAGGRRVIGYPVWMWHWADPAHPDLPWDDLVSFTIDPELKARALASFTSQTEGDEPMLSPGFLQHFLSGTEYFVASAPAPDAQYFDASYERHDDPWGFTSRWYEKRKRAVTLASLPDERYDTALELGCSIGVLTAELATRCDDLLAIDVAQAAVDRARQRVDERVRVERADLLTEFPQGRYSLIVFSEVGYYFHLPQLDQVLDSIERALAPGGTLVACHWRHPVVDYPLRGDEVHERLRERGLPRLVRHVEEDFVLEVFSSDPTSVAARTGLL